ncbi:GGDEF domain-containing protein [Candidatus Nomurabacteria bacterium]|nr:GGDEF domain-containing protein [Candidatus Nomurabacteria bacterium]
MLNEIREKEKFYADFDYLTGIFNRRALIEKIRSEIDGAGSSDRHISLLVIDVDRLKLINDEFGHKQGDDVLKTCAGIISDFVRSFGFSGRYGGDEFIVCLPDIDFPAAFEIAEKLRKLTEMNAAVEFDGRHIGVTISIGVSTFTVRQGLGFDEMLSKVDDYMYIAKKKRNHVYGLDFTR